jgi:flagellar basal body rod protein FlgF
MNGRTLFIAAVLFFGLLIALFIPVSGVMATGAPSDNMTIPGFIDDDQSQGEIMVPVDYIRLGPSAQSDNTTAGVIPSFIAPSTEGELAVTGNEQWYLDVDINVDGWIYIYEYYPEDAELRGRWIAYKMQLPESGIWEFGPFVAGSNEPEGQHIYRIWFYNEGTWVGEDAVAPQGILIYWSYQREIPPVDEDIIAPPPPPTTTEQGFIDKLIENLYEFIVASAIWFLALPLLVILVVSGFVIYQVYFSKSSKDYKTERAAVESGNPVSISSGARARVLLPNYMEIKLNGSSKIIGRDDLVRTLGLDALVLISRRHVEIKLQDDGFYIQDLGSANGTSLNGEDISNSGMVTLNDGDIIGLAGVTELQFNLL